MGLRREHSRPSALIALLCAVAVALGVTATAQASTSAVAGPTAAAPLVSAKVVQCQRGPTAADRVATFRAGMRRTAGSRRLSVRFNLQESVGGARYRFVKAPGLGVWRNSRAGVGAFAFRQRVRSLADGSAYRVVVHYRWQNARGTVLKTAKRRSRSCRQTGPLPNLRVQRIGGRPVEGSPDRTRYALSVINVGIAASPAAGLELTVDGSTAGRSVVPALAAGQITRVFIQGPKCLSGVGAEVDPDALVREANEVDNDRSAACPAS